MNVPASTRAQDQIDHIYGYTLTEIRKERTHLGLPDEFDLIFLVQSHGAPAEVAHQIIQHFEAGEPVASLKELLPDPNPKPPHAGKSLTLFQHQEPLRHHLEALYARGEHDTGFYDYHRPDATLLYINNTHCHP